jgi:hypothetical protein
MQRRGVAHFHAIIRLDGIDSDRASGTGPPRAELNIGDLADAVEHAARIVAFTTDPHRSSPEAWYIGWSEQADVRVVSARHPMAKSQTAWLLATYLAKYAIKATEVTGHISSRLNDETVDRYADADSRHPERLVNACLDYRHSPRMASAAPLGAQPAGARTLTTPRRTDPAGACGRP